MRPQTCYRGLFLHALRCALGGNGMRLHAGGAKKRPARQHSGGLIATLASSEIALSGWDHSHLALSNSHSEPFLPFQRSGFHLPATWRLVATFTKPRFELTNWNQRLSNFSSSNKNADPVRIGVLRDQREAKDLSWISVQLPPPILGVHRTREAGDHKEE